jgi:ribosomal protein S18 acetylase RimI-like enzyme
MHIFGGTEPTLLKRSPLDSQRFGLEIYRGHIRPMDVAFLWDDIAQSGLDIGIFRLPAHAISAMKAYTGPRSQLIHADTLVYYEANLDKTQAAVLRNTPSMYREANWADQTELIDLVFRAFANYENHYHANPAFSHTDVLAGYGEWAVSHLNDVKQCRTWVATDPDGLIGFMCCSFNTEKGEAEIVLNGVSPEHARKGVYSDLLNLAKQHFAGMGLERIRVSTQIGNYAVQRAWTNEGFRLVEAFDTWHVNAFLSHKSVAK